MRLYVILLLTLGFLSGCDNSGTTPTGKADTVKTKTAADAPQSETERINAWFDARFEEELAFSPIWQSMLGRKTDNDKIDDFSNEAEDEQLAWRRQTVADMKATFDRAKLSPEAQTSWDLWEYRLQRVEAADQFRTNDYIFNQMTGIHTFLPQVLIAFHPVDEVQDMEAYVARIREAGRGVEQLIERSRENAAAGVRPPRFAFGFVSEEAGKLISGTPLDESANENALWADANRKIDALLENKKIDNGRADALREVVKGALLGHWKPAYEDLIAWQKEDRANAAEQASGVHTLPNGEAYYKERLAYYTTTDLTADEIHQTGLSEVARLRREMEDVKDKFGFKGDLNAFFAWLRETKDDERLYFPNTDEGRQGYLDTATAAIDGIKAQLPNYFGILPKADMVVKRVEPFREQDGAPQHYFPGTPDGSRDGIYYAHLSDMKAMPKRELEVVAYHEGLPGHHMQISIAQELEDIPMFRTQVQFGAYTEGWGLYAEYLASEMPGTYEDPLSEFGRLGSEMWRAIRLVVDTGLHAKGWSEEKALQYFLDNSASPKSQAAAEIRRYIVLPGQATGYKIGMLKILELREKAREAVGDKFDIRGFHDTVLGGGELPLTILERRVDAWVNSQQDS